MMKVLTPLILILFTVGAVADESAAALEACSALPKPEQQLIARLVGHAGTPLPDTWTVVVHDPIAQNGLKEYTVTAGVVVRSRGISDLAPRITKEDVIGLTGIKFDATQVAELAASYAEANQLIPASLNYELRKEGAEVAPLWKITAVNEAGVTLGDIVVTANTGTLVSQTGFPKEPPIKDLAVSTDADATDDATEEKQDKPARSGSKSSGSKSTSSSSKKVPATFKRIGGHLQKFFTGKSTIGR